MVCKRPAFRNLLPALLQFPCDAWHPRLRFGQRFGQCDVSLINLARRKKRGYLIQKACRIFHAHLCCRQEHEDTQDGDPYHSVYCISVSWPRSEFSAGLPEPQQGPWAWRRGEGHKKATKKPWLHHGCMCLSFAVTRGYKKRRLVLWLGLGDVQLPAHLWSSRV